jgi:hypothetical protein
MTGDAVTWNRRVQGLKSSGKEDSMHVRTGTVWLHYRLFFWRTRHNLTKSHENVKRNVVDGDEKKEKKWNK